MGFGQSRVTAIRLNSSGAKECGASQLDVEKECLVPDKIALERSE